MEIHGYTGSGSIDATIDGVRMTVPDDPANRHRQMIAEWEVEGNTIPAYVAPTPVDLPLSLQDVAGVRLVVDQDNWDVSGVERCVGVSGAFLADTDIIWVLFAEAQPDTNYIVVPDVGVTKFEEFVEVTRPGLTEVKLIIQRVL